MVAYLVLQVSGCLVPVCGFHTCGVTIVELQCLIIILVYITHLGVCGLAHDTFLEIWNVIYILRSHLHTQVTPGYDIVVPDTWTTTDECCVHNSGMWAFDTD